MIQDTILLTTTHNLSGIILNKDVEKAFHLINYSLEVFKFDETFQFFIRTIDRNISSAVINNGEISEWFNPQRGIRQ